MKSKTKSLLFSVLLFGVCFYATYYVLNEMIIKIPELRDGLIKDGFIFAENISQINSKTLIINLIFSSFIFGIIMMFFYEFSLSKKNKKIYEERIIKFNKYIEKYGASKDNIVKVKCLDCNIYTNLNKLNLVLWSDEKFINIINGDHNKDIGKVQLSINEIIFFSRFGDFYTETKISGGGTSYSKAALGYLLAGDAGAIIASREGVKSSMEVHDNRETLLILRQNNEEKFLIFSPELYNMLMHSIPTKEINHLSKNITHKEDNPIEELKKLGDLKEKGLITDEEFAILKSNILKQ